MINQLTFRNPEHRSLYSLTECWLLTRFRTKKFKLCGFDRICWMLLRTKKTKAVIVCVCECIKQCHLLWHTILLCFQRVNWLFVFIAWYFVCYITEGWNWWFGFTFLLDCCKNRDSSWCKSENINSNQGYCSSFTKVSLNRSKRQNPYGIAMLKIYHVQVCKM